GRGPQDCFRQLELSGSDYARAALETHVTTDAGELAYSAATAASFTGSTRAAQNLNSGILPNGSSCGFVSRFAAASVKQKGMNTMPSATSRSARALRTTWPRRVETLMNSPGDRKST